MGGVGVELGEDFGVADVGPVAGEFEGLDGGAGLGEGADGVGEFVFAAGGGLEEGGVGEDGVTEGVDAGVIPRGSGFAWLGFFAEIGDFEAIIDENGAAFGDFFGVIFDADEGFGGAEVGEFGVIGGIDEDIAVAEDEGILSGEVFGEIDDAAGAVLDGLGEVFDGEIESGAVAEVILDDLGAVADDDEDVGDAGELEAGDDMFEDGSTADGDHGFGEIGGEFVVFVELVEQLICVGVECVFDGECVDAGELSVDEQGVVQSTVHAQGVIRDVVSGAVAALLVEEFSNCAELLFPFFIRCCGDVVEDLIGDICEFVGDTWVCCTCNRCGMFVADLPVAECFSDFGKMHAKFVCCSDSAFSTRV